MGNLMFILLKVLFIFMLYSVLLLVRSIDSFCGYMPFLVLIQL